MNDASTNAHHQRPDQDLPDLSAVRLFPLPNVVLFPRLILPLHIFEERYKAMTADALTGDRQIAMALLKPGWEKSYYERPAIEPVVCVGTILSHERLPDGKYNFLLQGHTRARVVHEHPREEGRLYRVAALEAVAQPQVLEIDLTRVRQRIANLFSDEGGLLARLSVAGPARKVIASSLPTEGVIDWLAFHLFDDIALKHGLLAEPDVRKRADVAIRVLHTMAPTCPTHPHLN
jgi:hypothetical protein